MRAGAGGTETLNKDYNTKVDSKKAGGRGMFQVREHSDLLGFGHCRNGPLQNIWFTVNMYRSVKYIAVKGTCLHDKSRPCWSVSIDRWCSCVVWAYSPTAHCTDRVYRVEFNTVDISLP